MLLFVPRMRWRYSKEWPVTLSMIDLAVHKVPLAMGVIGCWAVRCASEAIKRRMGWVYQGPV